MQHFQIKQSITDRSTESVDIYLKEISKFKILTPEEEFELATKMYQGDDQAKDKLIKSNLRFVISLAKQYQGKGVEFEDLIAVGNCGLLKAVEKFNPELGYRFLSYAGWWIRDFIINEIINHGKLIRVPFNKTISINRINKLIIDFETKHERTPTADELSELLQLDEQEINELLETYNTSISYDLDTCNAEYTNELDCGMSAVIPFLKENLSQMEFAIISKSFGLEGEELELKEIAKQYNLTRERVRQVRNKAIIKLRKHPNINNLFKLI
jgi:RNA polymerase primary sigma factor